MKCQQCTNVPLYSMYHDFNFFSAISTCLSIEFWSNLGQLKKNNKKKNYSKKIFELKKKIRIVLYFKD